MNLLVRKFCNLNNMFLFTAPLVIGLLLSLPVHAAQYDVFEIGTLGGANTNAIAINNANQVVGQSQTSDGTFHVFILENGVMTDLGAPDILGTGASFSYDINDLGHIIGLASLPPENLQRYFLYDGTSVYNISEKISHQISTLTGNGLTGLNNQGVITAVKDGLFKEAYVLTPDGLGGYTLQAFGYPGQHNWAIGLNDNGHVIGMTRPDLVSPNSSLAIIYDTGSLYEIGTLGGTTSQPYDVNENGHVVGFSQASPNNFRAFLYDGNSMTDLDTSNGPWSSAYGINDLGDVVGAHYTLGYDLHAFIYQNSTMVDLNTLIDPDSGWVLEQADDINNNGWILGKGLKDGITTSFLLVPVNEPPVANVGGPYVGFATVDVQFDGSASSDPEGQELTYQWDFGDGNSGTSVNTFHAYANSGVYQVSLVVNDGENSSDPAVTTVTVDNHPPVADAGDDASIPKRTTVYLDGSLSHDPDGSVESYQWTQVSGRSVKLKNTTSTITSFRAPNVKTSETLVFELTVIDNENGASSDMVIITVVP